MAEQAEGALHGGAALREARASQHTSAARSAARPRGGRRAFLGACSDLSTSTSSLRPVIVTASSNGLWLASGTPARVRHACSRESHAKHGCRVHQSAVG